MLNARIFNICLTFRSSSVTFNIYHEVATLKHVLCILDKRLNQFTEYTAFPINRITLSLETLRVCRETCIPADKLRRVGKVYIGLRPLLGEFIR